MKIKTWYFENLFVSIVLLLTWFFTGHLWIELIGVIAVFCGFVCTSIGDRLAEKQSQETKPSVNCFRLFWYFFLVKEISWLVYFSYKGAWSALIGCIVFILYPFWRKLWRKIHPMKQ